MGNKNPEFGDIYSGLDRFGRIKDCRWYNNTTEEDAVRLKYGYDRGGVASLSESKRVPCDAVHEFILRFLW